MFVDVDDYLLPDTLKDAITVAEENPEAEILVFGHTRISSGSITHYSPLPNKYDRKEILDYIASPGMLGFENPWAKLYKRSFINSNNLRFNTNQKIFEDVCFNLSALNTINYLVSSELIIYYYNRNESSTTARFLGEKFIDDGRNCLNTLITTVNKFAAEFKDKPAINSLSKEIIWRRRKTICHNTLYQIYNLYRHNGAEKKYKCMNCMIGFMKEISPNWQLMFPSSFPHLFVSAYKIHPRCADILLRIIFIFKH